MENMEPEGQRGESDPKKNMGEGERGRGHWRIAVWGLAALVLALPLLAMQFTSEVDWTGSDFVFAGALLFGSLGAYEIAVRTRTNAAYRAGVGLAIAATFLLIWINAAVQITDSAADGLYFGVAALGIVGVVYALVWPRGGAYAMFGTAIALGLVYIAALATGLVPNQYASALEVLSLTGFYAALFVGAGGLLRRAACAASADQGAA
jgi:hypothetical protein